MVGLKRRIRLIDQGHLPLPADLLEKHQLRDGDEVTVEETDTGLVITPHAMDTPMTTEREPFVLTPPSPEQLARRKAAVADIAAVKAKMPSLAPLTAADLVHLAREEASWCDTTEDI